MSHENDKQVEVLIADDHPLFRDGLARTIRQSTQLRLVAEATDPVAALDAIRHRQPDVAILDVELNGLHVLAAVAQDGLPTRIVLLAEHVRPDGTFEALAAGASGYLSKRVDGGVVCDAVCRIAAGGVVLCHEAQTVVSSEIALRHHGDRSLPPREHAVLVLMRDGLSYPEIGRRLHVAPSTVKTYAGRLFERLGVHDRVGAVVEGMRRGILD
jgi:two-component system, NarL family, nitrate/nitrite response regulator NarL